MCLQGKTDVNSQAYNGNTALHLAVSKDQPNLNIIKMLIKSGADPDIENYDANDRDEDDDERFGNSVYDICEEQQVRTCTMCMFIISHNLV